MTYHAQEFADAIRDAIAGASLSFTPTIVMVGDLAHYPANLDPTADLPAVFVESVSWDAEPMDVGATAIRWQASFRVVVLDEWSEAQVLHDQRTARVKAIWNLFMGSGSGALDLAGSTVAGPYAWTALPVRARSVDLPEEADLTLRGVDRVFAVDVWIRIDGETTR